MIGKFFKKVDLYGKLPSGLAEPTMSGAAVSMVTMAFLALMVISELIVNILNNIVRNMFPLKYLQICSLMMHIHKKKLW
jgi:hypothetical protein